MTPEFVSLAVTAGRLPAEFGRIFYFVLLPILLLAGIGFVLQRKLGLEMRTLVRLNFYFVVPPLIYVSLVTSLTPGQGRPAVTFAKAMTVVGFSIAMLACLAALTYVVAVIRRVPREYRRAMLMTTMFYNSGNYGLPLQELAFRSSGLSAPARGLQIFVVLVQNFSNFTIGILLAAGGRKDRHWKQNLLHVVKFPPIYALAAALITIQVRNWLGGDTPGVDRVIEPFWAAIVYVKEAFFAIALATLGAQLAVVSKNRARYPVTLSVILRLLVAPAIGLGLIYLFGLKGLLAQVLLIGTATPTAVNCMLLCLEFDNHPDYAARAVFHSTLLSPLTVTLVVFLAQGNFLPGFAITP